MILPWKCLYKRRDQHFPVINYSIFYSIEMGTDIRLPIPTQPTTSLLSLPLIYWYFCSTRQFLESQRLKTLPEIIPFPSFLFSLGESYIVSLINLNFSAWLGSVAISLLTRFMIVQWPLYVSSLQLSNNPSTCSFPEVCDFSGERVRAKVSEMKQKWGFLHP